MKNVISAAIFMFVFIHSTFAQQKDALKPGVLQKSTTNDSYILMNANRIGSWLSNNGDMNNNPQTFGQGLFIDNTKTSLIYEEGIVWGGFTNETGVDVLKVGGSTYRHGLQAGKIVSSGILNGSYTPPVADDPSLPKYRVYKIKKGWENLPSGTEKNQYEKDYNEWPISDGAPGESGVPKILGDETAFYVANDMSNSKTISIYGSQPLGIEQQVTQWASKDSSLNTVIFKQIKLINKSGLTIKDFYYGIWSDPDVLDGYDDRIGFDTLNSRAIAFTDSYSWTNEKKRLGIEKNYVVSYEVLQNNSTFGNNSSQTLFASNPNFTDPALGSGYYSMYYLLKGLTSFGAYHNDPFTGLQTSKPFNGDPLTGSGYTDESLFNPSDKKMMLNFGPVQFEPEQEIILTYAIVVTEDENPAAAIFKLYSEPRNHIYYDYTGRIPFKSNVEIDPTNSSMRIEVGDMDANSISIDAIFENGSLYKTYSLYDDGTNGDKVSSDHIWSLQTTAPSINLLLKLDVKVNYPDGTITVNNWVTRLNHFNPIIGSSVSVESDNLNSNGVMEESENVNFKVNYLSSESFTGKRVKLIMDEISEPVSINNLVLNEFSISSGNNPIPQSSTFNSLISESFDFIGGSDFQGQIESYILTDGNNIIRSKTPVTVSKLNFSTQAHLATKTKGNKSTGVFGVRAAGMTIQNIDYKIKVESAVPINPGFELLTGFTNYNISIIRKSDNSIVKSLVPLPLGNGYNQSPFDNVLLSQGTVSTSAYLNVEKTSGINLKGVAWGGTYFNGGIDYSYNFQGSSVIDLVNLSGKYEIRFLDHKSQKGYFFRRGDPALNYGFVGYFPQPFEVWDVSDIQNPRKVNFAVVEQYGNAANDSIWAPTALNSAREQFHILNSTYDGDSPDISGVTHFNYTNGSLLTNLGNQSVDAVVSMWLIRKNAANPPYLPGDVFKIYHVPPVAPGDEFEFNPVTLKITTGNEIENGKAFNFSLNQNYPNPFNPSTLIRYTIPMAGTAKLSVFNILGQRVWTTNLNHNAPGNYSVAWNGVTNKNVKVASGVYLYSLEMNKLVETRKMILMK